MALVRTAGVTFTVVMVIAVKILPDFESVIGKILRNLTDITVSTAYDLNIFFGKCIYRTAADTAANKNINSGSAQQNCQCAVS